MAKIIQQYQCDYCNKIIKTENAIKKHENRCTKNPNAVNLITPKINEVEEIRKTSKSIHEVIQRLQEYWLSCGIEVAFTSYPSEFSLSVSNSHNSPKGYDQNFGRRSANSNGYPGWSGNWTGTIKIIKKSNENVNFSDLSRGTTKLKSANFIKTGTGGSGDNFRISGMMFLYDFPVMHQEFIDNGNEFKVLKNDYIEGLESYFDRYVKKKNTYIEKHHETIKLQNLKDKLIRLRSEVNTASEIVHDNINAEFNSKYNKTIEMPSTMMLPDKLVHEVMTTVNYKNANVHPELNDLLDRLTSLSEELDLYKPKNPEKFI